MSGMVVPVRLAVFRFPACKFRYQFAYALVVGGGNVGQFCLGLLGYGEVQM